MSAPRSATVTAPPPRSPGRNVLSMVAGQVVARAVLLLAFLTAARAAGPNVFGQLNIALGVLTLLGLIADPGLHYAAQRTIAATPEMARQLVVKVSLVRLLLASVAVLGAVAAFFILRTPATRLTMLYAFTLLPSALALSWAYSGAERFGVLAGANVLNAAIYAGCVLLWVQTPEDVVFVPVGLLLANLGMVVLQYVLAPKAWLQPHAVAPNLGGWRLLREGLPFGLALLLSQMLVWIDSFLLMAMLGSHAVGIYHAAYRWILLALGLATYFPQALFPRMLRLGESHDGLLLLQQAVRLSVQLGVGAGLCLFALSPWLVTQAFGSEYEEAQSLLRILAMLIPLAMYNSLAIHHLNARRREKLTVWITSAVVACNALLNVVLILTIGIQGAAWALVLTEIASFALCSLALAKAGLDISESLLKSLVSLVLAGLLLWLLPYGPALRAGAALLAFFFMLLLTGELRRARWRAYRQAFWRTPSGG